MGDHPSFGRHQAGVEVRQSVPADIPHLRAVAHASHRQGRFHVDPSFPQTRCDELYAVWIERSCQGYADAVFVGEIDGLPVGYLSCHLTRSEAGRIGLFGVDVSARRRGLGSRLIHDAADWFGVQGVSKISVVTQRRNDAAMRLYKKHGFKTESKGHWYHLWPESVDG